MGDCGGLSGSSDTDGRPAALANALSEGGDSLELLQWVVAGSKSRAPLSLRGGRWGHLIVDTQGHSIADAPDTSQPAASIPSIHPSTFHEKV